MRNKHYEMNVVAAVLLAAAALGAAPAAAAAEESGGWTWVVEPYLWASSVRTNLKVDQPPIQNSTTKSFRDILKQLNFAGELHLETQTDDFGFMGDVMYISLDDSNSHPRFNTRSSASGSISELAVVWSPGDTRYSGFEGFAGIRNFGMSFDFKFTPDNPAISQTHIRVNENWTDFLIGVRYTLPVSKRWAISVRGDTGIGDTDANYNIAAAARYHAGRGTWIFGYRYMDTKFNTSGRKINLEMYGPEIGYAFVF